LFVPVAWRRAKAAAAAWESAHPDQQEQAPGNEHPQEDPGQSLQTDRPNGQQTSAEEASVDFNTPIEGYLPTTTTDTRFITEAEMDASHAILVDLTTGESVAQRLADERIYPASLTKIMTVLVAVESLTTAELETTFAMTAEIVNAAIAEGASRAGFEPGERIKLIDLLYGAAVPSGADATAALAQYLAGSEEKYVELMNAKAKQLGLTQTHFVNASGLHHDDHYSTVREIAALMSYAMENELCRKLLSAASYTTTATDVHPYGITMYSTTFSRMSTTTYGPVSVIAGKTGYPEEARFCLATLAARPDGREYVLVTVGGSTKYTPVSDCDAVYGKYLF
jgi:D-alanyl-D-alanine carboxypeptidase (penicillin-binding protein 5/6)